MTGGNVFPYGKAETESVPQNKVNKSYREAVSEIILNVKAQHKLGNQALADQVGCCRDTIANAEDARGNLDPDTLIRMAKKFGPQIMQPIRDLYDRPLTPEEEIDRMKARLDALKAVMR